MFPDEVRVDEMDGPQEGSASGRTRGGTGHPMKQEGRKTKGSAQGTAVGELELSLVLASLLSRREAGVSWGGTGALRRGEGMKLLPRGEHNLLGKPHTVQHTSQKRSWTLQ